MTNERHTITRALHDEWIGRAEHLEAYARRCRADGFIQGPEGAEDAEAAARDYRIAAAQATITDP